MKKPMTMNRSIRKKIKSGEYKVFDDPLTKTYLVKDRTGFTVLEVKNKNSGSGIDLSLAYKK
jgi:hypothetical protein